MHLQQQHQLSGMYPAINDLNKALGAVNKALGAVMSLFIDRLFAAVHKLLPDNSITTLALVSYDPLPPAAC